mmetsp:Transcript_487/g.771  ORF Transcript_487/g.771 Transcript_487/m.771 type:complete len:101 (+) Transcript_487:550-852(+)
MICSSIQDNNNGAEHLRTPSSGTAKSSTMSSSNQYPNDINRPTLNHPMVIATLDLQFRVSSPNHSAHHQCSHDPLQLKKSAVTGFAMPPHTFAVTVARKR